MPMGGSRFALVAFRVSRGVSPDFAERGTRRRGGEPDFAVRPRRGRGRGVRGGGRYSRTGHPRCARYAGLAGVGSGTAGSEGARPISRRAPRLF